MSERIKIDLGCRVTPNGFELCSSDEAWMEFEATVEVEHENGLWVITDIKAESMHDYTTANLEDQFLNDAIQFIVNGESWKYIQTKADERRLM